MISNLVFKVKSQYEPFAPSTSPIIRDSYEKAFTLSAVTAIDFVISELHNNHTTIVLVFHEVSQVIR